jgi:hypothetical protein
LLRALQVLHFMGHFVAKTRDARPRVRLERPTFGEFWNLEPDSTPVWAA